jgi:L-aspartate oxidase
VSEAPDRVRDLERLGFHFDADRGGRLALGLEGGHTVRRIVHAGGSATGRRLLRELSALVVANERVRVIEGARVSKLLVSEEGRCEGVVCGPLGDDAAGQAIGRTLRARAVVLSTGGAAALWWRTTNPPGSVGQGLLLARDAGASLADLEFVQFHPTAVIGVEGREGFLITEAIRGEGATLHDADGERFVDELAPRDEVSRAIQARLRESGARSVSLDMRSIDPGLFPNVVGALREAGLDPTRALVPVAPAAHYTIGGVVCDLRARSDVAGLYAVGETACTGLHGANRLASNSLSECFVFGRRAALAALEEPPPSPPRPTASPPGTSPIARVNRETRTALWRHAGIERSAEGLRGLLADGHPLARLIARAAMEREESRGTHARVDRLELDEGLDRKHAVALPGGAVRPDGQARREEDELCWQTWK